MLASKQGILSPDDTPVNGGTLREDWQQTHLDKCGHDQGLS